MSRGLRMNVKRFVSNILVHLILCLENRVTSFLQRFKAISSAKPTGQILSLDVKSLRVWARTILLNIVRWWIRLPFVLLYWIYVAPIIFLCTTCCNLVLTVLKKIKQRAYKYKIVVFASTLVYSKYTQIIDKLLASRILELVKSCTETLWEIVLLVVWPFSTEQMALGKKISEDDISELVSYEEFDNEEVTQGGGFRRTLKAMHNYIPTSLFKASIRVKTLSSSQLSPLFAKPNRIENLGTDSPASFPPTPFSRAFVLNKSSERVVSVMFAARDRLRLEAQSVSKDEYSRMAAKEAQCSGQLAVFDSRQTSGGIALTCGNHCAVKVGKGLCCSCRAMIPVRTNSYVYFEFSITVSSNQVPTLGIGLCPPDCPLNVMVGSWKHSLGLYNDGQVLVGSCWSETLSGEKINAGATVGVLVYLPLTRDGGKESKDVPEVTSSPSMALSLQSQFSCQFNVNGKVVAFPPQALSPLNDLCDLNPPLYPTVSLFSEETKVWCRFCEADIVYRSRESIGAPEGVRVYCLDGSLLLDEAD